MSLWYILDENLNPVPETDITKVAKCFAEKGKRIVGNDVLPDSTTISTVFLCLDHSCSSSAILSGNLGKPLLYETMVFGGKMDGYCERYRTKEEAILGHQVALTLAREAYEVQQRECETSSGEATAQNEADGSRS